MFKPLIAGPVAKVFAPESVLTEQEIVRALMPLKTCQIQDISQLLDNGTIVLRNIEVE